MAYNETTPLRKAFAMFDFYRHAVVFLYHITPMLCTIILALAVLNGVRLMMVKRRRVRAQARRAAVKSTFNTFETL